ncbi:MAG: hypothetical protein U5N58_04425 [Actinomycetota bacterium]|nr:hypothetical protein [Actinomycetota bacterium]
MHRATASSSSAECSSLITYSVSSLLCCERNAGSDRMGWYEHGLLNGEMLTVTRYKRLEDVVLKSFLIFKTTECNKACFPILLLEEQGGIATISGASWQPEGSDE